MSSNGAASSEAIPSATQVETQAVDHADKDTNNTNPNTNTNNTNTKTTTPVVPTQEQINKMKQACKINSIPQIQTLLQNDKTNLLHSHQNPTDGISPLMIAAQSGQLQTCQLLIDKGAPWNAVDRKGKCAGNYATDGEFWEVVNFLVDAGTKAELILGASIRLAMALNKEVEEEEEEEESNVSSITPTATSNKDDTITDATNEAVNDKSAKDATSSTNETDSTCSTKHPIPVEHEPCTKPNYLNQNVRYNAAQTALLDSDNDAVMMEWERPLMKAHASIITSNSTPGKVVLNVGFGMGIIDSALQELKLKEHFIIEAHPIVYEKMKRDGWEKKVGVRVLFGTWQEWMPKLVEEGVQFDGIFYDTYGEHFTDLEDFQGYVSQTLVQPSGIYSFFNGLAPDNLFFHGVACQCVKLQLGKLGLDSEFVMCDIQVKESEWEGVRRKYWHGREQYYLPIVTWNKEHLSKLEQEKQEQQGQSLVDTDDKPKNGDGREDAVANGDEGGLKVKKQKIGDGKES